MLNSVRENYNDVMYMDDELYPSRLYVIVLTIYKSVVKPKPTTRHTNRIDTVTSANMMKPAELTTLRWIVGRQGLIMFQVKTPLERECKV